MKTKLLLPICLFLALSHVAQDLPIQITTVIPPPYPQTFEEGLSLGDNSFILLQNTDMSQGYEVKLTAKISSDNGVSIEVLPEATPTQPITLAPGETRTVFGQELEALYLNYSQNDLTYTGIDLPEIANNPYMPEGTYVFCVKAWDFNTSAPLTNSILDGCASPIYITTIDPPIITFPFDEQEVNALTPQQVIFSWTPVSYNSVNLRYAFQMVDYTNLDVNVYDLLDENDFLFYDEENIIGNTLIYGPNLPNLIPGHDYAVRVKAYLLGDELNIHNGGFSDVVRFHYTGTSPYDPWANDDINPFSGNPINPIDPFGGLGDIADIGGFGDFTGWGDFDFTDLFDFNTDEYETNAGTGDNIVDEIPPLISDDLGCDGGCNPIPISNMTPVELETNTIVNLGHFQLEVSQANGSISGGYTGDGFVQSSSFFPYPVQVSFTNLKVNSSGQIIEGQAKADVRDGSWLDESWDNIQKNFPEGTFGDNPQELYDNINDPAFRIEQWSELEQSAAITLPAGYGEGDYKVQITEMTFGPDQAFFDAMVLIPLPDDEYGTRHLVFTGDDFCLSQSGPSIGSSPAVLSLSETVRFSPSEDIALKITSSGDASFGEGTFVQLDCNGFFSANIEGQVLFSPEVLKAEDENGNLNNSDTLAAAFSAEFQSWDSWIGEISFGDESNAIEGKIKSTRFQYTGLEGYTFKLDYAQYDHDASGNLPDMTFPASYNGSTGNGWQGLLAFNIEVLLPKWAKDDSNDERLSIGSQVLLMDGSGLSGQFDGYNLTELENGTLGGWDFSVDEIHLLIVSNTFQMGDFTGQLKMPISEDPFNYTTNIQHIQGNTQHNFVISTSEEIGMPAFLSEITLAPNSSIGVEITNSNEVQVEALLNGHIDLPQEVGLIPGCDIKEIAFHDMAIRNFDEVFEIGSFGTEDVSTTITVASVAVGLAGLGMTKLDGAVEKYELGFDLDIQLGENDAGVSGVGKLVLLAQRLGTTPEDFSLTHESAEMNTFQVAGNLPGVNVVAMVDFFDEPSLGHGFSGEFVANFIDVVNVEARAMFGSKVINNNTKKFFLVEGMGTLATGFPVAPPVSIYGFGGGIYYNIKPSNDFEINIAEADSLAPTLTSIASNYTFDEGSLGLKAACVVGLKPPDVFNADVALTVFIDSDDFSVESMNFEGKGYMMTKITDRSNPMMNINAEIDYNFTTKILHGEMEMDLSAPANKPLITANGTLKIHAGKFWYIKFGEPETPVHGLVDLKIYEASLDAYFMSGQNLPPPIIPQNVQNQFPDYEPTLMGNSISTGTGVAMGVHARVVSEIDVFVAYMNLDVGAGFDFTAMSYSNALCNGSTEFGINQWYANVGGYIYGDLAFTTLDYEWLSINAGLIVEGALPNPTGFHGHAQFSVETFIKDFSVSEDFSIGEICQMQSVLNEDGEVVQASSPIQGMDLIKNVIPAEGESDVDLFHQPKVQFHIDPNETLEFNYPDGHGNVINEEITFSTQITWQEKVNGNFTNVHHTEMWDEASKTITFTRVANDNVSLEIARPNTEYKFNVKITPGRMVNGSYEYFTDEEAGGDLEEIDNNTYTTGQNITSINDAHIDFCRPYKRQRYVTPGDYNNAVVRFNVNYAPAFEEYQSNGYSFNAEIFQQGVSSSVLSIPIDYSIDLMALYDITSLEPENIYKVVFTAEKTASVEYESNDALNDNNYTDATGINVNTNASVLSSFLDLYGNGGNDTPTTSTAEVVLDKVDMFQYFFRTSKYQTLAEKINTYSIVNSYVETKPTNLSVAELQNLPPGNPPLDFGTYKSINMELVGGEPFDELDLFAPDIQMVNQGMSGEIISFQYSGSDNWYGNNPGDLNYLSCDGQPIPTGNQFNPYQANVQSPNFNDINFKTQMTQSGGLENPSFDISYIGVSPPLSDSEIMGSMNNGSTQNNFGSLFGNNNFSPSTGNLTLIWRGDLAGKQFMCSTLCTNHTNIYEQLQSGNYNFNMKTNDVDMHWSTPTINKPLTINLQMQ